MCVTAEEVGGGVDFTLTEDFCWTPKNHDPPSQVPVGLSAPYLWGPVASRRTFYDDWLFSRQRTIWLYFFTDSNGLFCFSLHTDHRPPTVPLPARSISLKGPL